MVSSDVCLTGLIAGVVIGIILEYIIYLQRRNKKRELLIRTTYPRIIMLIGLVLALSVVFFGETFAKIKYLDTYFFVGGLFLYFISYLIIICKQNIKNKKYSEKTKENKIFLRNKYKFDSI